MMRAALGAPLLALALTIAAGCAVRQVPNQTSTLTQDAALSSLLERDRLLNSLQTPAIMDYSGPSGHVKAREQLTVRRPASLRVDAMSPLGLALIVAADERQIAVFNPSDNTLIRGQASAATLARFTRIPLLPADAVRLLLGLSPGSVVPASISAGYRTEGDVKILSYGGAGAGNYQLGFSGGQLVLVRARNAAGQPEYEIHYSDYRDIGAMKFPFDLEARFLSTATTIKIHYLNPSIDRQIADSTFVLSPGPATKLIELGFAAPLGPSRLSPG